VSRPGPASAMRMARRLLPLLAALALGGCASGPPQDSRDALVVVVVRHAEKTDDSDDPGLSAAGIARAASLAERLAGAPVVAAYATDYRRTRETLAPTAATHGLPVHVYDAREPADAFAARLRRAHPHGTVVVSGHSNTVPAIVAALCACRTAAMDEGEFGRISTVRIDAHGGARLEVYSD
jgi:broad specificity phosphatase PhoE